MNAMTKLAGWIALLAIAAPMAGYTEEQAADAKQDAPAKPAQTFAEGSTLIGETITVAEPALKLAAVRGKPEAYFEKTILVEATIAAVCQSKGCWMTVTDEGVEPIWVRWSTGCGGKYAFPKDAVGRRVVVQGSFYAKEVSPAEAEHLAAESKTLKAEEIAKKGFEMNATACVLLPEAPETAKAPAPAAG